MSRNIEPQILQFSSSHTSINKANNKVILEWKTINSDYVDIVILKDNLRQDITSLPSNGKKGLVLSSEYNEFQIKLVAHSNLKTIVTVPIIITNEDKKERIQTVNKVSEGDNSYTSWIIGIVIAIFVLCYNWTGIKDFFSNTKDDRIEYQQNSVTLEINYPRVGVSSIYGIDFSDDIK